MPQSKHHGVPLAKAWLRLIIQAVEEREIILIGSLYMFDRLRERLEDAAQLSADEAPQSAPGSTDCSPTRRALLVRPRPVVALASSPDAEEDARVLEAALTRYTPGERRNAARFQSNVGGET